MERDQQHSVTRRRRYNAAPTAIPESGLQQPDPQLQTYKGAEPAAQRRRRESTAAVNPPAEAENHQRFTLQTTIGAAPEAATGKYASTAPQLNRELRQPHAENSQNSPQKKPAPSSMQESSSTRRSASRHKTEKNEPKVEKRTPESFDMRYSRSSQPVTKGVDTGHMRPAVDNTSEKQLTALSDPDPDNKTSEKASLNPTLKKRLPYYIGIAVCSIVLIVSGTLLIRYYSQVWRANRASNQLRTLYTASSSAKKPGNAADPLATAVTTESPAPPAVASVTAAPVQQAPITSTNDQSAFLNAWPKRYPGNEGMVIQTRFEPLRHENRDIVGWLSIDGVLDEPVFQRDNSYYLTHDATGTSNPTGALFLDENCNLRTVPMVTLIHGHNMKEGAMFGSLKKYKVKDASFYRQHPFVTFDSLYETATYVIFSVAEVNIVPGNTHYFPFWHRFSFESKQSFDSFVLLAKEYSRFKVDIDVQPGDRLLTLATCSSEDSNLRLIVMARMLRKDEDKVMLTNKIYSAVAK